MAPRESKVTVKEQRQRASVKLNATRKPVPVSIGTKKTMSARKTIEQTPMKGAKTAQSHPEVNAIATPKPKENKTAACPGSVTKSAKKAWKRRPKPAHSGVPVPEKMKRILQQQLQDSDCSF